MRTCPIVLQQDRLVYLPEEMREPCAIGAALFRKELSENDECTKDSLPEMKTTEGYESKSV